ncbi:hypothetical protein KP509_12G090100 [Ceratopteris richardii]|uniref:RING-type domain-containing protein n=1 Tax=Ceratopteris richardii TaxID=49495 RepID=A0A8T2TN11_CERRI|nr:hypothetical protein KP509_12G090100 [Ceratopteris richardii]
MNGGFVDYVLRMKGAFVDYVLEHLPQACDRDINHVVGEFADEDGDLATGFILADPVPPGYGPPRRAHLQTDLSKRDCPSPREQDACFICTICSQCLPLEELGPDLNCSCLCCVQCLKQEIESALSQQDSDFQYVMRSMNCPSCSCEASISPSCIQLLAPDTCKDLEAQANNRFFEAANYMHCPNCDMLIEKIAGDIPPGVAPSGVPEFDRTAPFTEFDDEGRPLSRTALFDKYRNYYRCSLCKQGFCGLCMHSPYHLGYTCEGFEKFKNAKRCVYCDTPILAKITSQIGPQTITIKELQRCLDEEGIDASWCVEKSELLGVWEMTLNVCDTRSCREKLHYACTRKLACGHQCKGVKGEKVCLPCLEDECRESASALSRLVLPRADDWCMICMVEPLCACPSIQLKCGHIFHFDCAKKKVKEGFPGPEITFGFLKCPQCSKLMEHESLIPVLRKPLELLSLVKEKAVERAREEKSHHPMNSDDLEAYSLSTYNYYLCSRCQLPYYGGNRDCQARLGAVEAGIQHNPLELVCGGCSAAADPNMICSKGHGTKYIEFKCKFCCSLATYFCFGRTHFCSNCHVTRPDGDPSFRPEPCRGPQFCPLKVVHAPNGEEYCLGCSMCRILSQ